MCFEGRHYKGIIFSKMGFHFAIYIYLCRGERPGSSYLYIYWARGPIRGRQTLPEGSVPMREEMESD